MKKKRKGFTLIELLVVIAIIGMLAGIVLVSMGSARAKARDARRQSDIRQISLAMEMCLDDTACGNNNYPAIAAGVPGRLTTDAIGTFMPDLPADPGGGTNAACGTATEMSAGNYCAFTSAAGGEYCIYAILNNGDSIAASERGVNRIVGAVPASLAACP